MGARPKDTRGALCARPGSRWPQPAFEGDAPLYESADEAADRLGREAPSPGALSLPGGCGHREGFRQAAVVGRVDLLVCQETQDLRAARGGASVVRWPRRFSYPDGFPDVATQTLVRSGRLPHQTQAGGD